MKINFNNGRNDWTDPAAWLVIIGGTLLCVGWFLLWL